MSRGPSELPRRDFVRLTALAPLAIALGCSRDAGEAEIEAALRRFILAIGPWGEDQRMAAEDFVDRFLRAPTCAAWREAPTSAPGIPQRLDLDADALGVDELDLSRLDEAEREVVIGVVLELYGTLDVHYVQLCGTPLPGICAGREHYTRAPTEWNAPYRRAED